MNLRRYLMIKQAMGEAQSINGSSVLNQDAFNQMRGPNAGKVTRQWNEFFAGGAGNQAMKNRQAATDANAYTQYLQSQGLGNNALSKEDFVNLNKGNMPQVKRTWGEFFSTNPFTGKGVGAESFKNRQDLANTNAYNAYLKQQGINRTPVQM